MIVTLTPNPSIDRTVAVPQLQHGEVNRACSSRIDPGGKGVNISRALSAHGTATVAVLPLGGPEGHLMAELLDAAGVRHHGVEVPGTLRMNIAVVEPDGTTTKFNEPGPVLTLEHTEALLAAIDGFARPGAWVVGSGSLPPGADDDFLATVVTRARARGALVAIDSSGSPMAAAIKAGPDLIKPNHEELEELVDRSLPTLGDVVAAAREVVASGVATVVVSLGGDGAVLVDAATLVHAGAQVSSPLSTVGAGDCLLAGVLHVLAAGGDGRSALECGVRWGAAAVTLPGSEVPGPREVHGIPTSTTADPDLSRLLH